MVTWLVLAGSMGGLLALAQLAEGPLDDPDLAEQRPGYLDAGDLPVRAPPLPGDLPSPKRRTVVFVERPERVAELCRALRRDDLGQHAALVVIVSDRDGDECGSVPVVVDQSGSYVDAIGFRHPEDHGPPVGYAVIDSHGQVRYRTLDPEVDDGLEEVETIIRAVP
jgi:hypothetical protein